MTTTSKDPSTLHNPYFEQNPNRKDVWTLINETAAKAQEELGKPVTNLGQGFFPTILLILLWRPSTTP
ncbi:CIC11C00000002654 [Sungouiella intermedia]|uniref:CIC11C00000002654 n=1 Tax=Sungouiella intermedia TaxID=45354 RepID=A0A1L0C4E4_9ASCO|nr:CIC11C00000002654 [[Candida] intermedia]